MADTLELIKALPVELRERNTKRVHKNKTQREKNPRLGRSAWDKEFKTIPFCEMSERL